MFLFFDLVSCIRNLTMEKVKLVSKGFLYTSERCLIIGQHDQIGTPYCDSNINGIVQTMQDLILV